MKAQTNIHSDLAQIRARVKEGVPVHDILRQAALVTHFDLFKLSEQHADSDEAMLLLMDDAIPLTSPADAWGLPLEKRQSILNRFEDRAAVLRCLATIKDRPDNRTQRAFERLMSSHNEVEEVLQSQDAEAIADILDAMAWIARAPRLQEGLPDRQTVTQALADARRMAPLRRLVGDHFQGRKDVLEKMRTYLEAPEVSDVLFLHGPGGIGKSTVLAKFALDAADRDDVDAIVYLNLDRPILRPEEPLSLLLDLLSQLARQFPDHSDPLIQVSGMVRDFERRLSYSQKEQSLLESTSSAQNDWDWIVSDVAGAIAKLPGTRQILVLVDTFEQAQRLGSRVVSEMWRMTKHLMGQVPRMRIIAAGRLEEVQFTQNRVALEAFERSDVERVLTKATKAPLSSKLIDDIFMLTDGHPLTVQLAASFVDRAGPGAFDDPELAQQQLSELKEQKRDALLYGRILQQINDPQVQQIAIPGLVMRRITPGVIREVLAEPCNLTLEPGQEDDLFDRMAAEVDLVSLDYSDPEAPALVHRPDVRALMLSDLRQEQHAQAAEIDDRAIQYFSEQDGDYARAEEIYHRLWRGDFGFQLENRWMPGVAPLLVSALDELPPNRQGWLADKLGVTPAPQVAETLDLSDWESSVAAQARQLLKRGDARTVLTQLSERTDRTAGSELLAIEAEAQVASGDEVAGLAVLDRGISAAMDAGETENLPELLLLRSQLLEGRRQFAAASQDAARALNIAQEMDNQEFHLRATASLLRLSRKSRSTVGPEPDLLRRSLSEILDTSARSKSAQPLPKILYNNPVLTRELAAEVGDAHPDLLELSIRQTGSVAKPENDTVGRKFTQAVLQSLAGTREGDFGQIVQKITDGSDSKAIQNLPELLAVARDRRVLDTVKQQLSWLLSAEVDRLVGAFPSKSMIKRTTGVQITED
ncbi:P-loop domain-containing protein [Arenibacterium sp. CAU 1754]